MAKMQPLLGSVRGSLGALSFIKGNKVQLRGPGTFTKGGLNAKVSMSLGKFARCCVPLEYWDWLGTLKDQPQGVTLWTRLAGTCSQLLTQDIFDRVVLCQSGVLPLDPNPPGVPEYPVPRLAPTEVSVVVDQDDTTIRFTREGSFASLETQPDLYLGVIRTQDMRGGNPSTRFPVQYELEGAKTDNYVEFTLDDISLEEDDDSFIFFGAMRCFDDGAIQPLRMVPRPSPYHIWAGTFCALVNVPPNIVPPPPP